VGMVRILSGWSNPGGSTVAFINLTNLLNKAGIDAIFYDPHNWHLDKCRSANTSRLDITDEEDTLIAHFVPLKEEKIPIKKVIFSCHETILFPLKEKPLQSVDTIHFVSEWQRDWQDVDTPSVVIPNIVDKCERKGSHKRGAVGIIGSIDSHKQTALAIQAALDSEPKGTRILIFGSVTDEDYYQEQVRSLIKNNTRVKIVGKYDDKTVMYNMIDAVYHASRAETYGLVRHECEQHGIPFNDLFGSSKHSEYWEEDRILESWKTLLEL